MEDMGDKGARRGGKHNLNFEDHVFFSFCQEHKTYTAQSWCKRQQWHIIA